MTQPFFPARPATRRRVLRNAARMAGIKGAKRQVRGMDNWRAMTRLRALATHKQTGRVAK